MVVLWPCPVPISLAKQAASTDTNRSETHGLREGRETFKELRKEAVRKRKSGVHSKLEQAELECDVIGTGDLRAPRLWLGIVAQIEIRKTTHYET